MSLVCYEPGVSNKIAYNLFSFELEYDKTSAKSDQSLCSAHLAKDPWEAQADPSLCWAHKPFGWFCHALAHLYLSTIPILVIQKRQTLIRLTVIF